jgi:hypothetical protein
MARQQNVIQPMTREASARFFRSDQDRDAWLVKNADIASSRRAAPMR